MVFSEYTSFYNYNEFEELNVEKFNKISNLGINAEDMFEMLKSRFPNKNLISMTLKLICFQVKAKYNNIKQLTLVTTCRCKTS